MVIESLERYWEELEAENPDRYWNALRVGEAGKRQPLLVVDEAGFRHLLVPARKERYRTNTASPLSVDVGERGFTFLDGTSEMGRYLDISCRDKTLNRQFDAVIRTIFAEFGKSLDFARAATRVVSRWRELFAVMSQAPVLTLAEKMGLFAELSILRSLVTSFPDFSPAWWTGPQHEPHDFELPECSIEVKAIGEESGSITIHGLRQLEELDDKPLYLLVALVKKDPNGLTISELFESVANHTSTDEVIRRRAAAVGVFRDHDDSERFVLVQIGVARVDNAFPRIGESLIPKEHLQAFGKVTYKLHLESFKQLLNISDPESLEATLDEFR